MVDKSKYVIIPEHMREGIRLWIEEGIATGSFLVAFLENDLREAMIAADDINRNRIFDIFSFFWTYAPSSCWGSPEKVKAWREKGGLLGKVREHGLG